MTLPSSNAASQSSEADPRHDEVRVQRPRLAPPSMGGRVAALALATLAASVCVGSQFGLVALHSGEADQALAYLRPDPAASRVVASALPGAQRALPRGTKFDPAQGDRRPWEHGYGHSEE